jgi:hypothetical protein
VTPDQLDSWRLQLAWSDGDGLDGTTCGRLLDEIERLRLLVRQAHRGRALGGQAGGTGALTSCACPTCTDVESDALVRAVLRHQ